MNQISQNSQDINSRKMGISFFDIENSLNAARNKSIIFSEILISNLLDLMRSKEIIKLFWHSK
jgi:hypothetical protein